ncbi:MAG: hypothetical protein H6724_17315, partial [Sandaracinus sp.]|nr:hypothetical protein [Sandaracinus sp.]
VGGCGGFRVEPTTAPLRSESLLASTPASHLQVVLAPGMAGDKIAMLQRHHVLEAMHDRIAEALRGRGRLRDAPGGPLVLVVVREFRNPRYGESFLTAEVEVRLLGGEVAHRFVASQATNRVTSRTGRLRILAQGVVDAVVAGL